MVDRSGHNKRIGRQSICWRWGGGKEKQNDKLAVLEKHNADARAHTHMVKWREIQMVV